MSSTAQTVRNKKTPVVAIAGATGAVGVELMACLEQRKFPLSELRLVVQADTATTSPTTKAKALDGLLIRMGTLLEVT